MYAVRCGESGTLVGDKFRLSITSMAGLWLVPSPRLTKC
jgi:hypothetical protein